MTYQLTHLLESYSRKKVSEGGFFNQYADPPFISLLRYRVFCYNTNFRPADFPWRLFGNPYSTSCTLINSKIRARHFHV